MSYILDALKKSEQERQQGASPSLHSIHGSMLPAKKSASFAQHRVILLTLGGFLIFFGCLGGYLLLSQRNSAEGDVTANTDTPLRSTELQKSQATNTPKSSSLVARGQETSPPQVVIKEKQKILRSIAVEGRTPVRKPSLAADASQKALPLLEDLPAQLQAEIPNLQFAGHTYAEEPSQRMIIVNGRILREGDMAGPGTYLTEITWEGVIVSFKGSRFRVITN